MSATQEMKATIRSVLVVMLIGLAVAACSTVASDPTPAVCVIESVDDGLQVKQDTDTVVIEEPALLLELGDACRELHSG